VGRIDHALHEESNDAIGRMLVSPYLVQYHAGTTLPNWKHKLRTHVRVHICARPWNIYREFSIYERNDRPEIRWSIPSSFACFSCEFTSVLLGEFKMLKNIRKFRSLNYGFVEEVELYRPEQFNCMQRRSFFFSFFFSLWGTAALLSSMAQLWFFRNFQWTPETYL